MCGIFCIFTTKTNINLLSEFDIFKGNIEKRGPDSLDVKTHCSQDYNLLTAASVLWLQGKCITKQPLQDSKSVFVYNGDIFGGIPDNLREENGDTKLVFEKMTNANTISSTLSTLNGPYAFIYFNIEKQQLYFGRDIYGRRSLLIGKDKKLLILTSVAKRTEKYEFMEIPSIGTFCLDLKEDKLYIIPWQHKNNNFETKLNEIEIFLDRTIIGKPELPVIDHIKFVDPKPEELNLLNSLKNATVENAFETLLNDSNWLKNVLTLKRLLEDAIRQRILTQPSYCKHCILDKHECDHALVGILFSGGVDCAVLALLASKVLDKNRPIDLINVAFDEANKYLTPDRITAMQTLEDLRQIDPERKWNLIEVNVSQNELNDARERYIADLIYPLKSILDDDLGCALWFASRAKQCVGNVTSPVRVLLVGMGADELFGGYTRHRAAFKKQSWLGLHNMLNEDWQNISYRNLGRDDRVVSDHGRQLRTPYLDENVVNFVRELNCWEKTFPSHEVVQGLGEKVLLRSLAYHIGLKKSATFKKRALQFGSRIANKKENAHDISKRLCLV